MLRFFNTGIQSADTITENSDCLTMNRTIWKQGRKYFKYHRNVQKIPVMDKDGSFLCYAFQDTDADRELRMLQELNDSRKVLHFEDVYPEYHCVMIQECNELAYSLAKYLQSRGIPVIVSGKYWDQIEEWHGGKTSSGNTLTIYAEGTWEHNGDLSYELMRSASVEFEYVDNLYKENIKRGFITNAKCSYQEWIEELRDKEIILIGTGNRVQDIYDMLAADGLDIAAFLSAAPKNGLRLLGKEIIGTNDLEKYTNPVFIEVGKNSALGAGHLDEYVYYGCRRNQDFFFFQDYADVQKNSLSNVLAGRQIVLLGDELLSGYLKQYMVERGKEENSVQYYETLEKDYEGEDVIGIIAALEFFGVADSAGKWRSEINHYKQMLKEHHIEDHTLYFTMTNSFVRLKMGEKRYFMKELRPKGILMGAINAHSGNVFFRDCLDNHPNIIQLGYTPFENNLFYYCIRLAQMPVSSVVPALFESYKRLTGEECFQATFPKCDVFRQRCEFVLNGIKAVTPQELFVMFAVAYNEMMGRGVHDISQTYIYWEPHSGQDIFLRFLYMNWLGEEQVRNVVVYLARNSLISAGAGLRFMQRTNQKLGLVQMMRIMLNIPYILDLKEEIFEGIILKFEELKLSPKETWQKLCDKLDIPWSDTFLNTTRFGKSSSFNDGDKKITGYDLAPVYRDHADLFSPFDKMRICYCKAKYQKMYGYPYEDTAFTMKELREMFLKEFKSQRVLGIDVEEGEKAYFDAYEFAQRRLREIDTERFWDSLAEM